MEPIREDENNVHLLKDMLDIEDQQCALEVYSEMRNDEFETLPDFPDEIHIDINMYPEEFPYNFEGVSTVPKRITAANQVLPLLKSVYEDRSQEEEISLANEWQEVFQALSTGSLRDHCECLLCNCYFVTPSKLLNHVKKVHAHLGFTELQHCFVCRQRFVFPKALSLHLEQHHGLLAPHLTCSVCFTQLTSQSELKAHKRKHSLTESCQFCYNHFPSRQQLAQHLATAHIKQFSCPNCRRSFDHEAVFRTHLARHEKFSTAPCANCSWQPNKHSADPELAQLEHLHSFHSPEQLQLFFDAVVKIDKHEVEFEKLLDSYFELSNSTRHIDKSEEELCLSTIVTSIEKVAGDQKNSEENKNEVVSLCKLCTKTVISLDQIPQHVQEFHSRSKQCPICKNRFPSVKRAQAHTRLHLKTEPTPKEYKCRLCDTEFKDTGKLNRHLETTHMMSVFERPFSCNFCSKSFLSATIRDKHLSTHHENISAKFESTIVPPLKCNFCNCKFIKSSYLAKHIEKYHNNIPTSANGSTQSASFQCKHCNELLSDLSKLKRHMVFKHGAAKEKCRFKCNLCKVSCRTAVSLKVHMRTHTKVKPHECDICGKSFNRKHALNVHKQRVHLINTQSKSSKNVYCCALKECPQRQPTYATILRHYLRAHRDVKRFICGLCGECYSQNQELKIHMQSKHNLNAPNIAVKETSKQTDIHVFPSVEKLPSSHPHAMLITQISEDQYKKTLNLPTFPVINECDEEQDDPKTSEPGNEQAAEAKQSQELSAVNETIIYDTSACYQTAFPDLESIAAPNTASSLKLASVNNETYLSIINKAYEKINLKYPEMVAAVVNVPDKEQDFNIPRPIVITTNSPDSILLEPDPQGLLTSRANSGAFECDTCHKTFQDRKVFAVHLQTHSSLSCDHCQKIFSNKQEMEDHKKLHLASKSTNHVCPRCPGRVFKRSSDLKRHLKVHQDNKRSFLCHLCGAVLTRKDSLLLHQARKHGVENFRCESCKKSFKLESQFRAHLKTHTATKEHECDICGRSFALRGYLLSHRKRHEKQKDYVQCPHCSRKFTSEQTLLVHEKSFHTKGAMLLSRQQKQEAMQRQVEAQKASFVANLEEEMLQVDFDLEDSQVVYLKVLSDADLEFLPS